MAISDYLKELRRHVGTDLIMMPSATAIIHNEFGELLMVHTADGHWITPGGALDPGETAAEAVVRELAEELGVVVEPERILGVYQKLTTYPHGDQVDYTSIAFRCRIVGGELSLQDDEIEGWEWVTPSEAVVRSVRLPEHVLSAGYDGPAFF